MQFLYYRIIYLNIILMALFLTNQFFLFFLFIFFKLPYLLNFETDIDYQFDFIQVSFDDLDARYLENDIDNEYYYVLIHMEIYLYHNCHFFFDVLGGEATLDYIDYIDHTIYDLNDGVYNNINRNYKYIYNSRIPYITIKTKAKIFDYKIYQLIETALNDNYQTTQIKNIKNIINSNDKENKIKIKNQQIYLFDDKIFDKIKEQQRLKIFDLLKKKF
jgi:hypothetical protein